MKAIVSLDHRFARTPDGRVYSQTMFGHRFWLRYLDVFDSVRVIARLRPVEKAEPGWHEATGEGVSFAPMPYYLGFGGFVAKLPSFVRSVRRAIEPDAALILRAHFMTSSVIYHSVKRQQRPIAIEVIGNPRDNFSPGTIKHPMRPLIRHFTSWDLAHLCKDASASLYVTEEALQLAFPPTEGRPTYGISDVELYDDCYVDEPHPEKHYKGRLRFICVGMFETLAKAQDIQIQALAKAVKAGCDVELAFVGGGRSRGLLEVLVQEHGLHDRVHFLGKRNAGADVRAEVDKAHIFLLPSRQEGLPRAMVEAMARALPAIGSQAGGMYELIGRENLVTPNDIDGLAEMMIKFSQSPRDLAERSARNLARSRDYHDAVLSAKRKQFYQKILQINKEFQSS